MMLSLVGTGPTPDTTTVDGAAAAAAAPISDTTTSIPMKVDQDDRNPRHGSTATAISQQQQQLCGCGLTAASTTTTTMSSSPQTLDWHILKRRDDVHGTDSTGASTSTTNPQQSHNSHPDSAVYGVLEYSMVPLNKNIWAPVKTMEMESLSYHTLWREGSPEFELQ
jgi:hypothetical protein